MSDWKPDICIYHGDCLDGFGAAWAIWKRWRDCEFRPGHYGKPLPIDGIAGRNVLFVDFSAPAAMLEEIATSAASVVVLDHHKTAKAELEPYLQTGLVDYFVHALKRRTDAGLSPIVAYFEEERSGAVMAWELATIVENDDIPDLLLYIQDRDLWRFRRGDQTRHVAAALQSYPMDFETWDLFHLPSLLSEGAAILRAHQANVAKVLKEAYIGEIGGYSVPVVNAPYHYASDAGNELLRLNPDAPFAATWLRRADGFIQFSLRSENHRVDVSAIAKAYGGGGHRNSAGFQQLAPTISAAEEHPCSVCGEQLKADDLCASDIELGICHAACLEGSPVVDLETGEPIDGNVDTYRYGEIGKTPPRSHVVGIELTGVAEQLAENNGAWHSCSGCHELNEGHPTGEWSDVLKSHLGLGCSECGGIGAVWDKTDYSRLVATATEGCANA